MHGNNSRKSHLMGAGKRKVGERPPSSEQADLWEHATLLYHSFDWQSAADVFNHLSRSAVDDEAKAKCLLNEGLIFARLCDFTTAKKLFERAAGLDPAEVLPCFLLGLIEAELNHLPEALTQFEFCWETIQRGLSDHYSQGLRFELTADICRRNAEKIWVKLKAQYEGGLPPPVVLESISADQLFEAPARRISHPSQRSSASRKTLETLQASARSTTSKVWSYLRSLEHANLPPRFPSAQESNEDEPSRIEPETPTLYPLPRPKLVLVPRDPQIHNESLRELASFIRHAGPGGNTEVTIDRDYMMRLLVNDAAAVPNVSLSGKSLEAPTVVEHPATRVNVKSEIDSVLEYYADSPARRHSDPDNVTGGAVIPEDTSAKDPKKLIEDTIAELKRQAFGDASADGDGSGGSHISRLSDMCELERIPPPLSLRLGQAANSLPASKFAAPKPFVHREPVVDKAERLLGNNKNTPRPSRPMPRSARRSDSSGLHEEDDGRLSPYLLGTDRTPSTVSSMDIFKIGLKDPPKKSAAQTKPGWV